MNTNDPLDTKLHDRLLSAARVQGDYLVLADDVLRAALAGTCHLSAAEAAALQASPLTLRRLRQLSVERQREVTRAAHWRASPGLLRAASGSAPVRELVTEDGWWRLHFLEQHGVWRVILALDAGAPFAARLLREQPMLRVLDGSGAIVLHGRLDGDGECETVWPFELGPGPHFQLFGAAFAVEAAS